MNRRCSMTLRAAVRPFDEDQWKYGALVYGWKMTAGTNAHDRPWSSGVTETKDDSRNGAAWMADCLLRQSEMARANERLGKDCRSGIRHFSAVRKTVSLEHARKLESEISGLEDDAALDQVLLKDPVQD